MKSLPTLHNDSPFTVQFSNSVSKTRGNFAVYDKDF